MFGWWYSGACVNYTGTIPDETTITFTRGAREPASPARIHDEQGLSIAAVRRRTASSKQVCGNLPAPPEPAAVVAVGAAAQHPTGTSLQVVFARR